MVTKDVAAIPRTRTGVNLRRSKGFEGIAGSKDGKLLCPLIEDPLWDDEN
jgi:hypothetical protein